MEMQQEKSKSMYEKLKEDYERSARNHIGGHVIGFYAEDNEEIKAMYRFNNGLYTIRKKDGNFFWWDYDPGKKDL